jgi:hypothetical protein
MCQMKRAITKIEKRVLSKSFDSSYPMFLVFNFGRKRILFLEYRMKHVLICSHDNCIYLSKKLWLLFVYEETDGHVGNVLSVDLPW